MTHAQAVKAGNKAAATRRKNRRGTVVKHKKKKARGMTLAQAKKVYGRCPKCNKKTKFSNDGGRVEINCPTHGRVAIFDRGFA